MTRTHLYLTFNLSIDCDNAAFDNPYELPQLLRKVAKTLEDEGGNIGKKPLYDDNGNTVGYVEFAP